MLFSAPRKGRGETRGGRVSSPRLEATAGRDLSEGSDELVSPDTLDFGDRGDESTDQQPLLLKPLECAHLLAIGRSTMFELLARNELPVIRIGRCVRIRRDRLEEWIAEQECRRS